MGTKNALTEKVYSGKDIMRIAYPILISLLMEQMIGMTDTAFSRPGGERWNWELLPLPASTIWLFS